MFLLTLAYNSSGPTTDSSEHPCQELILTAHIPYRNQTTTELDLVRTRFLKVTSQGVRSWGL
jgi:hypothetical protein